MASSDSSLSYRRIRAPKGHGQALQLPDPSTWNDLWQSNCAINRRSNAFQTDLSADFFIETRNEIVQAALQFTRQYRDVDFTGRDANRIVMAGHQPGLFHAGVWYKNFVLANLAKRFNGYAINLIVDNDVCTSTSVNLPLKDQNNSNLIVSNLKFDTPGPLVPYETRLIQERERFEGFGSAVQAAIQPFVSNPLARRLWPNVVACSNDGNLGMAIAKGRHRLEGEIGLQTLELPVSTIADTNAFIVFTREILLRLPEFCRVYNDVADDYRAIHRIKNAAQPIPNLKNGNEWFETPFWIWKPDDPTRRSLHAKLTPDSLVLSNQLDFEVTIHTNASVNEFKDSLTDNVSIRPKALVTTLFSRLLGCDLFIHGIGGSKYDQLTDELCWRFFKTKLPDYLTVSGTFLIQDQVKPIEKSQINALRHQLRALRFHPEEFMSHIELEAQQLISTKDEWVKTSLPEGQRLHRHQEIERCNRLLQSFVSEKRNAIESSIAQLEAEFGNARILNSREYSYCLHDESLLDQLAALSQ